MSLRPFLFSPFLRPLLQCILRGLQRRLLALSKEAPPFQVRPLRCQDIFLADHPHYHPEPVDELLDRN